MPSILHMSLKTLQGCDLFVLGLDQSEKVTGAFLAIFFFLQSTQVINNKMEDLLH